MLPFAELAQILTSHQTFVITTHVNSDGDSIGSALTMYRILKALKKEVSIINVSEVPHYLKFLDNENAIEIYDSNVHDDRIGSCEVFIALDFNRVGRMAKMAPSFALVKGLKICIDHHQDPEQVFDLYVCSTEQCATGHILYNFIEATNIVPLTYELAEPLYAAIMTDTGSFRFERTTPEVHYIAAKFLELGVNPTELYKKIYDQNPFGKMKLLGESLSNIELFGENGQLAVLVVTQKQLADTGTKEDDTDGFVNICMSIGSVQVALKFLELKQGFKVSLRSKGNIPVHTLAGMYGGGGHKNASGIRFKEGTVAAHKNEIINYALEFMKGYYIESAL